MKVTPKLLSLIILTMLTPTIFAEEELDTFNQQEDINYPKPQSEESFLTTRAPMTSEERTYFGINIGPVFNFIKSEVSNTFGTKNNTNTHPMSYAAGIYGGFGANFGNLYIGAELTGGYDALDKTISTPLNNYAIKYAAKKSFFGGLDFVPGYLTNNKNILFYGRVGIGSTLYKLIPSGSNSSNNKLVFSLRTGVGMEYFLNKTISLRVECLLNTAGSGGITAPYSSYNYKLSSLNYFMVNLGLTVNM